VQEFFTQVVVGALHMVILARSHPDKVLLEAVMGQVQV
jgi:hypothetical protein